jgi:hypothetical protein
MVYGYAVGFSVRPVRLDCILVVKVGHDTVSQPEVIRKLNLVLLGNPRLGSRADMKNRDAMSALAAHVTGRAI